MTLENHKQPILFIKRTFQLYQQYDGQTLCCYSHISFAFWTLHWKGTHPQPTVLVSRSGVNFLSDVPEWALRVAVKTRMKIDGQVNLIHLVQLPFQSDPKWQFADGHVFKSFQTSADFYVLVHPLHRGTIAATQSAACLFSGSWRVQFSGWSFVKLYFRACYQKLSELLQFWA